MSIRRILKEIKDESVTWHPGVSFWPIDPNNPYNCIGVITGPKGSVYENGLFYLKIEFPQDYPFKPPKCTFLTKIYNPCVNSKGKIALFMLMDQWSPALTAIKALLEIQKLLLDFSVDDPLDPDIARQYEINRGRYDCIAREWTERFAM